MRRLLVAVALAVALLAVPATAHAADPKPLQGVALPNVAKPGGTVRIEGDGWPKGTQVQAVVCGDLAIGGSSTCAMSSAVLGFANDDGLVQLDLVVAAPPRPCPCVVRLSSYDGPVVAVDIPFVVTGHPVGKPPKPVLPAAAVTVTDVALRGGGGVASWFGAAPSQDLVITVRNDGTAPAVDPELVLGIGKTSDVEATPVRIDALTLAPGQTQTVVVGVSLPFAAFGDYQVVGQVGEQSTGRYQVAWSSYPWGLVVLNVLGLLLLAWGVTRRIRKRRAGPVTAAAAVAPGSRPYRLPDVVYVSEVGGFLVSPQMAGRSGLMKRVSGRLELQDLAAFRDGPSVLPIAAAGAAASLASAADTAGTAGATVAGQAVVDIAALDSHLARRRAWQRGEAGPERRSRRGPGSRRSSRRRSSGSGRGGSSAGDEAVVDLDAVDGWLNRDRTR